MLCERVGQPGPAEDSLPHQLPGLCTGSSRHPYISLQLPGDQGLNKPISPTCDQNIGMWEGI